MRLNTKLSIIIIGIIAAVITISSVITVSRSRTLQLRSAYAQVDQIAYANAVDTQRKMEEYFNTVRMLSQIMGEFETVVEERRRPMYNDIMRSLMEYNENFIGLWTAWLPNALDNMDDQYRNTPGSNAAGQFITTYTRRHGAVELMDGGWEGTQAAVANISREPVILDPVWREVTGIGEVAVITITYPIQNQKNSQIVGVVGINFRSGMAGVVADISKSIYNGKGSVGLYSNGGFIVAHSDSDRVKHRIQDDPHEQDLLGKDMSQVVNAIKNGGVNGKPVEMVHYSPTFKTNMLLVYHPLVVGTTVTPWMLAVGFPMNEVLKPVTQLTWFSIIFAGVVIIVTGGIIVAVARAIVTPIRRVTGTLREISEGGGDLTQTIEVQTTDEIADLAYYFNSTLEKIRNMVITIKKQATSLSEIGKDLDTSMSETADSVMDITSNIFKIKRQVISQAAGVSETNANMGRITENIDKLNNHVESQSASVNQSSSAVEEMLANIRSVTNTLILNAVNVSELMEASDLGRNGLQEVAADIREIARESEGILEINAVMENIAGQTNLLSMNAAIEAAHAGEAGKGFAVVADEIRKLAESSSEQSKTISDVLKKIKVSIDKITASTDNVLLKFEAIDTGVRTVSDQETHIRGAMEEQGTGSQQVLEAITRLNDLTVQVKAGSEDMLRGSKEVIEESKNLGTVTEEISQGVNQMAASAEQINGTVQNVNELSTLNRNTIDILVQEVARFKVE
ncbi:MAG: methyl-accepting chemotaxis protein [Spirochaetaceae bacterium]|jgi:methyl-accepting chemotaxis protein|nr:methyl-accepting chemotaxis protein [Spirochaetaceae bacterium]